MYARRPIPLFAPGACFGGFDFHDVPVEKLFEGAGFADHPVDPFQIHLFVNFPGRQQPEGRSEGSEVSDKTSLANVYDWSGVEK